MRRTTALAFGLLMAAGTAGPAQAQDAILSSARQLREAGELEAALTVLQQKLERDGLQPALAAELGLTESRLERWAEAARHLRAALAAPDDPHVSQHAEELRAALTEADQTLAGSPDEEAPPHSREDPFAEDVNPDAIPLPMPDGSGDTEPTPDTLPSPGGLTIPNELRSTLASDEPPAAPLVRTEWVRPRQSLPLLGVFTDFGTGTIDSLAVTGTPDELAADDDGRPKLRLAWRIGAELNAPLVSALFLTVRAFAGLTFGMKDQFYVSRLKRIADTDAEAVHTVGTWSQRRRASFGLAALFRYALANHLTLGVGARFTAATASGSLRRWGGSSVAFVPGSGCDYSADTPLRTSYPANLENHYGCSPGTAFYLNGTQSEQFERDWRLWFLDVQAVLEAAIHLTRDKRASLRLSVALGRPLIAGNVGLAVLFGPEMGANR